MNKEHIANQDIAITMRSVIPPLRGQYPIVFHHGMLPAFTLHGYATHLRQLGFPAFSTQLSAAHSIEQRAKQLAALIDKVLEGTKAQKVNIIAHSMGGVDSRYLISQLGYGDRVATLTTISSPHRGSSIAGVLGESALIHVLAPILNVYLALMLDGSSLGDVDIIRCFRELSIEHMNASFNIKVTDDPRVRYQSYAGVAGPPSHIPGDLTTAWARSIILTEAGDNDGIVSVSSATWGEFKGILPAPHSVLIGKPQWLQKWNYRPREFFEELANQLELAGF